MKKNFIWLLMIALVVTLGYKTLLPYIPQAVVSQITQGIERITGKAPQNTVVTTFEHIAEKNFQKAIEGFLPRSQKFYNPNYLKNVFNQAGKIKVSRSEEKGNQAFVYFQTENNHFLMANLIKEKDQWLIQDINDDPSVVID